MRKLFTLAAVGFLMLSIGKTAEAQGDIPWLTDWRQARDVAQKQHRLVLLHFWSGSCVPCKRLETNVFNRPEVARAFRAGYIPVKVNVDQDRQLATHYGVTSWPTDVIVDATGKVLHRQQSPPEAHQYVAFLDSIKSHHSVAMLPPQPTQTTSALPSRESAAPPSGTPGQNLSASAHRRSSSFTPGNHAAQGLGPAASGPPQNPLASAITSKPAPTGKPYANPFLTAPANNAQQPLTSPASSAAESAIPQLNQPAAPAANPANGWQPPANTSLPNALANNSGSGNSQPANAVPMANQYTPNSAVPASSPGWNNPVARQAMIPAPPQRPPLPTSSDIFGLESYCPVTLIEGNTWSRGDRRWGAIHRGRTYLFSKPEHQQRFLANPDAYAPVLSGYDPVHYVDSGSIIEGKRRHGLYYGSKYFLFSDEATLQKFQSNPNRYMQNDIVR